MGQLLHRTFTMALSISLYASLMSLSIGESSASDDGMFVRVAVIATSACAPRIVTYECCAWIKAGLAHGSAKAI